MKKAFYVLLIVLNGFSWSNAQSSDQWERLPLPNTYPENPPVIGMGTTKSGYVYALLGSDNQKIGRLFRMHVDSLKWRELKTFSNINYAGQMRKGLFVDEDGKLIIRTLDGFEYKYENETEWKQYRFQTYNDFYSEVSFLKENRVSISHLGGWQEWEFGASNSFTAPLNPYRTVFITKIYDKNDQERYISTRGMDGFSDLYYSKDRGISWETIGLMIGDFIVTKTGRVIGRNPIEYTQKYYTDDNGLTWTKLNFKGVINKFAQTRNGVLLVAGSEVAYSVNNGDSWVDMAFPLTLQSPYNNWDISDVISDSKNNVYVSVQGVNGDASLVGIYRYKGVLPLPVATEPESTLPSHVALAQNYPNPFNPSTNIQFTLPQAQNITLKVYDILGREVRVLFEGQQVAGQHEVLFDAKNLSSGMYVVRLVAGNEVKEQRITLNK